MCKYCNTKEKIVHSGTDAFMLGCLSSATSYVLNMVFSDEGIMIKHNYKQDNFFIEEE